MTFLKEFGAAHLVVFSPNRNVGMTEANFKAMCDCFNEIGRAAGEMGFRAGLPNHLGQMVQNQDEVDRCMEMTDPKLFWFSPDLAHLYLADCDPKTNLQKHKSRLMMMDYKDAKKEGAKCQDKIFDLGDGERFGPWGYASGSSAPGNRLLYAPGTDEEYSIGMFCTGLPIKAGRQLILLQSGGGGWGDPRRVPGEWVREDVANG